MTDRDSDKTLEEKFVFVEQGTKRLQEPAAVMKF